MPVTAFRWLQKILKKNKQAALAKKSNAVDLNPDYGVGMAQMGMPNIGSNPSLLRDTMQTKESRGVFVKQTLPFSQETVAPLAPEHRERFERIDGPACIRNEYKHTVFLSNDILSITLSPGESRVVSEVLKKHFDKFNNHNMVREWDPYRTLRDLVAEYERSQDPVGFYNFTTEQLCENSRLKVWKQRGQASQLGAPHKPVDNA